jgi:hypothetical protein
MVYVVSMNLDKIRKRVTGGFRPFSIMTSDGNSYEVPHPEFILVGKSAVAVTDHDGDIAVLDPLHIVGLKDVPSNRRKAA